MKDAARRITKSSSSGGRSGSLSSGLCSCVLSDDFEIISIFHFMGLEAWNPRSPTVIICLKLDIRPDFEDYL